MTRIKNFTREERLLLSTALLSYRKELEDYLDRSRQLGISPSVFVLPIVDKLIKEINEQGFWPEQDK